MRIPIEEERGSSSSWVDYNSITVKTTSKSGNGDGRHTFRCSAWGNDIYVVDSPSYAKNVVVTSASIVGVSGGRSVSYSGNIIEVRMGAGQTGVEYTTVVSYTYTYTYDVYVSPYTFTTKPHSGKILGNAEVYGKDSWIKSVSLDYTPDTLNGTIRVTVNLPSGVATHGTKANVDIHITEYELEKVAKVKHNGIIYKHIKFNGQVVV